MMKRRYIVYFVLMLFLGLIFWYFKNVYGWLEFRKNKDTPKEFLSQVVVEKRAYARDSIDIVNQLRTLITIHEGFFYSKEYFEFTQIIVDSIIYSPDLYRMAVFIIAKNPTNRRAVADDEYEWYYDATCYLGVKKNDTIYLSWIGPVFTDSDSRGKISNYIREACLRTYATKGSEFDIYKYNMNYNRFWDSPIWKEIEDRKRKRKEFEEEKIKHPENIYEPN